MEKPSDGANVRFPPPLIYVAGLGLGMMAGRFLHVPALGLPSILRIAMGGALVVAGIAISFAGARLFMRRRTAIIPYKPASALVISGVYRWTRNPMYLGMALIYAGLGILLKSVAALVLLPLVIAIVHRTVIAREEAYLLRAFGGDYAAYKAEVRPWI
jgi:protein-S-isoprenylcysteine O-methyltransferase Ste14